VSVACGCGTDVLLGGTVDSDAAPESDAGALSPADAASRDAATADAFNATPFPAGMHALTIEPASSIVTCSDSLAGREPEFSAVTRDEVGLVGGPVVVVPVDERHLDVTGAPIEAGYGVASLRLEKGGAPGSPEESWNGAVSRPGAPGPADTVLVALVLEAQELSVRAGGFDGRAGAMFAALATEGQCSVAFDAQFDTL
jgi:hypothetical protein